MIRKIVHINEEKCNGCGACAAACHEGAIAMIDGKAKLIRDDYCDGLGDCLPVCPADAIRIIEREAADYDMEAVEQRMKLKKRENFRRPGRICMPWKYGKKPETETGTAGFIGETENRYSP